MNNSQETKVIGSTSKSYCLKQQLGPGKMQPEGGEEAAGQEANLADPPLSFECLLAPPSRKVWMGQPEGLSDGVMAISVSTGQMGFPRVSELMAPQPGESFF